MDYYGYGPLVRLTRPLALCGVPGAEVGVTARVVTMFTGLPLVRLSHRVAHVLGQDHERAQLTLGPEAVAEVEAAELGRAWGLRAPPVVALTSLTLTDPALRAEVLKRADLIHLRLDLPRALGRIRAAAASDPGRHLVVRDGGRADDAEIVARLRFLDRFCREAPRAVEVGDRLPIQVGRALVDELEAVGATP